MIWVTYNYNLKILKFYRDFDGLWINNNKCIPHAQVTVCIVYIYSFIFIIPIPLCVDDDDADDWSNVWSCDHFIAFIRQIIFDWFRLPVEYF